MFIVTVKMEVGLELLASFRFPRISSPVLRQTFIKTPCAQSTISLVTWEPGTKHCSH